MLMRLLGGLFLLTAGLLPLISRRYRQRVGKGFWLGVRGPNLREGLDRARTCLYLSVTCLGAVGIIDAVELATHTRAPHGQTTLGTVAIAIPGVGFIAFFLLLWVQAAFNRPTWFMKPEDRNQTGALVQWWQHRHNPPAD